jgi:hypothetical protein
MAPPPGGLRGHWHVVSRLRRVSFLSLGFSRMTIETEQLNSVLVADSTWIAAFPVLEWWCMVEVEGVAIPTHHCE